MLLTPPVIPGMAILDWHQGRELAGMAQGHVARELAEGGSLERFVPA